MNRNDDGWCLGDRCLHRPSGQYGIVEGWKDDKLLVFWGYTNGRDYRDWVVDEDCTWHPSPEIPTRRVESVPVRQSGADLSEYPL